MPVPQTMDPSAFRPKKSLGQNFLVDENIARKIIAALAPSETDTVLEIGAGFGVLTKYLAGRVKRLIAVEIDRILSARLAKAFSRYPNVEIVCRDFLDLELRACAPAEDRLRLVGNIPYHITSPVIFKVLAARPRVHDLTMMIQKEVAQRVVARPGTKDYGVLSVFSQVFADVRILFHVPRTVFRPRPEVDASVVRWDFTRAPAFELADEAMLDKVVHAAFQQRRKMLRKSLKRVPEFKAKLAGLSFDLEKRPEQLSPFEFVELSNALAAHG